MTKWDEGRKKKFAICYDGDVDEESGGEMKSV